MGWLLALNLTVEALEQGFMNARLHIIFLKLMTKAFSGPFVFSYKLRAARTEIPANLMSTSSEESTEPILRAGVF
jgi:hypothetical protein